jgi:hypothetical protein
MVEFEIKGPEEGLVEKHIEKEHEEGKIGFASKVALLTAILSTVGALFGYNGGKTESETLMYKNEQVILTSEASNQWSYYQAKSTKQAIMEGALINATNTEAKEKLELKIKKYDDEKLEIQKLAKEKEVKAEEKRELSEKSEKIHHKWAAATTAIQIAISLAAITILTRRRWLFWTSLSVSAIGIVLGILSFLAS